MSTNLNLGLRHIVPVYPLLFISVAAALAALIKRYAYVGISIAALLAFGLVAETTSAYPNYIAFFNTPSGGWEGGIKLLGDSNLDWGQDMKMLNRWQQDHVDKPLYLAYFGIADAKFYGVNAIDLPGEAGGYPFSTRVGVPQGNESCYIAVSATNLQQIYFKQQFYAELLQRKPLDVLGGTIYIYELPLPK